MVRVRRLWPRSLDPPPLTDADLRSYELYAGARAALEGDRGRSPGRPPARRCRQPGRSSTAKQDADAPDGREAVGRRPPGPGRARAAGRPPAPAAAILPAAVRYACHAPAPERMTSSCRSSQASRISPRAGSRRPPTPGWPTPRAPTRPASSPPTCRSRSTRCSARPDSSRWASWSARRSTTSGLQVARWGKNPELQVLTQAMYNARELAMSRMRAEADHLERRRHRRRHAARCRCTPGARTCWSSCRPAPPCGRWSGTGAHRAPDGRAFTSDLTGQDFFRLLAAARCRCRSCSAPASITSRIRGSCSRCARSARTRRCRSSPRASTRRASSRWSGCRPRPARPARRASSG